MGQTVNGTNNEIVKNCQRPTLGQAGTDQLLIEENYISHSQVVLSQSW